MTDTVVVLRVHEHLLSLPFAHVDEILGPDRVVTYSELPEGIALDGSPYSLWVSSRGQWLPVKKLFSDQEMNEKSQILVVASAGAKQAFMVDQVIGIEKTKLLAAFPRVAEPFTDIPFTGVRFLKDRPVLELDLSRLISLDIRGDKVE